MIQEDVFAAADIPEFFFEQIYFETQARQALGHDNIEPSSLFKDVKFLKRGVLFELRFHS